MNQDNQSGNKDASKITDETISRLARGAKAVTSSVSPATPSEPGSAASTASQPAPASPHAGGGGTGRIGGTGGGRSDGNNPSDPPARGWSRTLINVLGGLGMLIGMSALVWISLFNTSDRGIPLQMERQKTYQLTEIRKTEEAKAEQGHAVIVIPPTVPINRQSPAVHGYQPVSPTVQAGGSFEKNPVCFRTPKNTLVYSLRGTCYRFDIPIGGGGMLPVRITELPSKIVGSVYQIGHSRATQEVPSEQSPTGVPICTKTSTDDCMQWLRMFFEFDQRKGLDTTFFFNGDGEIYFH